MTGPSHDPPTLPDAALRPDPDGPGEVLLVLERHPAPEGGTGIDLRYQALLFALRASARTDAVSVSALAAGAGCTGQPCPRCTAPQIRVDGRTMRAPFTKGYCGRVDAALTELLTGRRYRAVMVSHLLLHAYLPTIRKHARAPVILDEHNVEAELYATMVEHPEVTRLGSPSITAARAAAMEIVEAEAVRQADVVTVPSTADRDRLRRRYAVAMPIAVLPNAVPAPAAPPLPEEPARCVFVGALSYFPNTLAAWELCGATGTAIRRSVPGLELVVVGRDPPPALTEAARTSGVRLVANPAVVDPFLRRAVVLVPLLLGGGTRFKIIEAMAAGCPVVSTAKGIEGIAAVDGVHYLGAENPDSFAAAVRRTVTDRIATNRRIAAGWHLARASYSWESLVEPVAALLYAMPTSPR